ncbi:DUF2103 domain-containing protein [Methanopyrus kandleri]|uniref:DUF2103 domain-containing protein n=1 Tax=Methanopyrus kandleri TaxID=2320 RepID=A0A832T6I6_9EURY|nr:DUF2103 domain-containing protein [Methanopyrus kandleri]HII70494.1 DUF2103 domain-containing protein [Methanopyrus kandleri]
MPRCRRCGYSVELPLKCPRCGEPSFEVAAFQVYPEDVRYVVAFVNESDVHTIHQSFQGDPDGIMLRNLVERLGELLHSAAPRAATAVRTPPWIVDVVERISGVTVRTVRDDFDDVVRSLQAELRADRRLDRVEEPPERKLGGSHSTIIGGRRGRELVLKVASVPYVKRVIPGRIGAKGSRGGGGVRLKVSRVDDSGNVKLLLSEGAATQEIFVVTTARDEREGKLVAELLERVIR